jgi:LuxR family quorum sensing-dependent transcriptional regulator
MREARQLTPRERECLHWAAQGKTFQEISMILGISFGVVRQHLDKARLRLDAVNLTHAVAIAVAAGLVEVDYRRAALFAALLD